MTGYKTYLGLVLTFLGYIGLAGIVSEEQLAKAIDSGIQLVGIALAVYGNYKAHKKIEELEG